MTTAEVTPPDYNTNPLTLTEVKAHLRVDTADEDADLGLKRKAALVKLASDTGRALIAQTWDVFFDDWPPYRRDKGCDEMWLPYPPITSITSIKYTDSDGNQTTWGTSNYIADLNAIPPRVVLAYSQVWPSATLRPVAAIAIRIVCGYSALPDDLKAAALLLIGHWYRNREDVVIVPSTAVAATVPRGYRELISEYRCNWFGAVREQ